MLKQLTSGFAAVALTATPVLAAPAAPVSNPAASLSVAKSVRAGSSAKGDKLAGSGAIVALIAAAAIVAGAVIVISDDDDSDSN